MYKTSAAILLVICLGILLVGCANLPVLGNSALPVVNKAEPVKTTLDKETIELRNCDGLAGEIPLSEKAPVNCQVTIPAEANAVDTGASSAIPGELQTQLADQVKATYQPLCDEATAAASQSILEVPAGRIRMFEINWTRQTISSTVSYKQDDQSYSAAYTYTLDVPAAIVIMETGCTA